MRTMDGISLNLQIVFSAFQAEGQRGNENRNYCHKCDSCVQYADMCRKHVKTQHNICRMFKQKGKKKINIEASVN